MFAKVYSVVAVFDIIVPAVILLLIVNPKFEQIQLYIEKPNLVVAVDNSSSIKHLNQVDNTLDLVQSITKNKALNDKFNVVTYSFSDEISETDSINEDVYDDSDFHMTQLWFSALSPTTRKAHASKHGTTATTQENREFYSKDGNQINCLCSQSPVLANKRTGEILQKPLQKRMEKQKEVWQKAHVIV